MTISAYTLAQLQTDLQALLGDLNTTSYSQSQLTDAINFGIKRLCTMKHYTFLEATIPVTQTTGGEAFGIAPLFNVAAGFDYRDYIEALRVYYGGNYLGSNYIPTYEMVKTVHAEEAMRNPNWRAAIGFPERWFLYDGETIVITPFSSPFLPTGQKVITFEYVQAPALLVNAGDTPDPRIPYAVQQYIKYAAASWLLSLDQSDTTALATSKMYMETFVGLLGV